MTSRGLSVCEKCFSLAREVLLWRGASLTSFSARHMNAQREQEVHQRYCQLWQVNEQALIGKYFQKENLAGKGTAALSGRPQRRDLTVLGASLIVQVKPTTGLQERHHSRCPAVTSIL